VPISRSISPPGAGRSKPNVGDASGSKPNVGDAGRSKPNVGDAGRSKPSIGDASGSKPNVGDASGSKLNVGDAEDSREREADRIASRVMHGATSELAGTAAAREPSHTPRETDPHSNSHSGRHSDRPAASAAPPAPPVVHRVLARPGRPLDETSRAFFEPRFGLNLGHVRVHDDALAASSAHAIGARAYALGSHIAFARAAHQPSSLAGRELLAHELAHVVQQRADPSTILRQPDPAETERVAALRRDLASAIANGSWRDAARLLNAFSSQDIHDILATVPRHTIADIYEGAIDEPTVGGESAAARATRPAYLDRELGKAMATPDWGWAAYYLNGFSESDLRLRLAKLPTTTIQSIHDGALATASVGDKSNAALITAQVLQERQNAPPAPVDQAGETFYAALQKGLAASSPDAIKAAGLLASAFSSVDYGSKGDRQVSIRVTAAHQAAARAGISAEVMDRILKLIGPFMPRSDPLAMDYAGRVGTRQNLAERELADRLAVVTNPQSTLGSLMVSWVTVAGGTAADMQAASNLGTAVEGLASTAPLSAPAPTTPSTQESQSGAPLAPPPEHEAPAAPRTPIDPLAPVAPRTPTQQGAPPVPSTPAPVVPGTPGQSTVAEPHTPADPQTAPQSTDSPGSPPPVPHPQAATPAPSQTTGPGAPAAAPGGTPTPTWINDLKPLAAQGAGRRPDDPLPGLQRARIFDPAKEKENLENMLSGRPPTGVDGKPVTLHHRGQYRNYFLDEYTQTEHQSLPLHEQGRDSEIDRGEFAGQRERYWRTRGRDILTRLSQSK
jgi:hypothetical protein